MIRLTIVFLVTLFSLNISAQMNSSTQSTTPQPYLEWMFEMEPSSWNIAKVPGCIHTDLENLGMIENPLIGINESLCQWVGERDWNYSTYDFTVPDEIFNSSIIRIKFHQLDTYATVYLNDQKLFVADNAFRAYEVDVKPFLKKEKNTMRVEFKSPIKIGKQKIQDLGHPLPGDAMRAVTRKPQYHYGWDWGPKLVTMGITGPIEWIAYNEANITDFYINQKFISKEKAEIEARVTIHSTVEGFITLKLQYPDILEPNIVTLKLTKGINEFIIPLSIDNPKLWWCNNLGDPYLYDFSLEASINEKKVAEKHIKTGLRTIRLVTDKDDIGETFYFELNGRPVFAKGANYIPITMLPGVATRADYTNLLWQCQSSQFNMLRVWGGGYYETEDFYELCDSLGLMVWQDFMFACSMYPGDPAFLQNVQLEADYQTKRLRNHPSIALWCGNNENAEGWERWGWQMGLSDKDKAKLSKAYSDVFNEILPNTVLKNHPQINYWESSPRFGRGDKRSITEGDSHYWGLWHDEEPFEILNERVPRFMSEYGMQSYPNLNVLEEIVTTDSLNINDPGMMLHQKHPRGNKLMNDYMRRWFDVDQLLKDHKDGEHFYDTDFAFYAQLTQAVQAEGILMGIEAHRRNMPYCMGTLFWQLNDVWPALSWSAVDYKYQPKLLMSALYEVYAPILISPVVENDFLNIHYINDGIQENPLVKIEIFISNDNGEIIFDEIVEHFPLTNNCIFFSKKMTEVLGNKSPENCTITVNINTLDGELFRTRTKKLVGKSSAGLRMQYSEYDGMIYIAR